MYCVLFLLSRERGWPDAGADRRGGLVLLREDEGLTKGSDKRVGMMQEDEIWYLLDTRTGAYSA